MLGSGGGGGGGARRWRRQGKILVLTRALYGLKSPGASWRATLASTLENIGFQSTIADQDVWRRKAQKPCGFEYYELMLVYVDDLVLVSHDPNPTMVNIDKIYQLKEGSLGKPDTYLGGQIYEHHLSDGRMCWGMKSVKHIKNAVQSVEDLLREDGDGLQLKTTAKTPIPHTYQPELDITPELNGEDSSRYRQMIGILRWAVELGRVDMHHEVTLMSQYSASPREGHKEAVYHIFAFLKTHRRLNIVLDPRPMPLDENAFANVELSAWRDF